MHPYDAAAVTGFALLTAGTSLLLLDQPTLATLLTAAVATTATLLLSVRARRTRTARDASHA